MTVLDKLASALGRRDEVPNQLLATQIAQGNDKEAVKELVENLSNRDQGFKAIAPLHRSLLTVLASFIPPRWDLQTTYLRFAIHDLRCAQQFANRVWELEPQRWKTAGGEMKRIYILIFVLLVTGFVRGDAGVTGTQDPLVVNSKSIALKLENSRVRVLEATLAPGVKEKMHSHPAYVIYVIAGGKVRNHSIDGKVTEADFRTGDVIYREPVTHWAENIGKTTIRLELVELKN